MTVKLLISFMICLCIFSQSLAQVSESIESQDAETYLQQGTLAPGETIFIEVKNVPALTGEYTIDQSGKVDLPLIGKVKALEQTPVNFARNLEVLYEENYLQNPSISVEFIDSSAPSKPLERPFEPDIDQQINDVSNNSISDVTPADLTLEPVISPDDGSGGIETLPTEPLVNELTSDPDIEGSAEPSLALVDIKTVPRPIILEASSSLEGTKWSLGSDARKVIHFLSEGEMAGTVGCNNFFASYKEKSPKLDIRLLGSTFLDCADGTMPKEFIDLLEATISFAVTQNELHLIDKNNEIVLSFSNNHFKP